VSERERPAGPPRPSASGLTAFELALLRAVEESGGVAHGRFARSKDVLHRIEASTGVGSRYAYPALCDLARWWVRHLPLVEAQGNVGSIGGDDAAAPQYTEVRLSPVGALALGSERGETGPLPLELIEGSLHRGGELPPFDPATTIRALLVSADGAGLPMAPTGTIRLDPTGLQNRDGLWFTRYVLGSVIRTGRGPRELVLTSLPYLVATDPIVAALTGRIQTAENLREHGELVLPGEAPSVVPPEDVPVRDVTDESSGRNGVWIVARLADGVDVVDAVDWMRSVWPVTTYVDCAGPEEIIDRFASWRGLDRSGLHALETLLSHDSGDDHRESHGPLQP